MKHLLTIFKKIFVPFIGIFIFQYHATGQVHSVNIHGEVTGQDGVGITGCYIKISSKTRSLIYSYTNTADKNIFDAKVSAIYPDTLAVTISHIGYADTILLRPVIQKGQSVFLSVLLKVKVHTLNGITIKSPPVWRRGDTTFYSAKSFAEGSEKKLKDLLEKIPDFTITEDGQLRYKNKIIEKIMVDGEELFSDKINLMLNNFPAHLLKTIQAIQNQSNNKLLKGLAGDGKVVLNLGLDNAKLKAIFGDGEAGAGTASKYSLNPVLFSILGKIKGGFIGNWNNIGNGIGWQQKYEIKNEPERLAENWLQNNLYPQTILGFENRWYINNGQWDNRLQLNTPIIKRIKSQTEIDFLKDRQLQNSYTSSSYFDGNNFYLRNDSNHINYKPSLLKIRQTLSILIDTLKELKIITEYFNDRTKGNQDAVYNQNGSTSYLNNSLFNNWQSFGIKAVYTHRISVSKALESFFQFNHQSQKQTGLGFSPNWQAIYNLSNTKYTVQHQLAANSITILNAGYKQFRNEKKGLNEFGVYYDLITAKLQNTMFLNDVDGQLPKIAPAEFNNHGNYVVNKIRGNASKKIKFNRYSNLSLNSNYGFSAVSLAENNSRSSFITPEYDLKLNYIPFTGKAIPFLDAFFVQQQLMPYQLHQYERPTSSNAYKQYSNIKLPLRHYELSYSQRWNWPHNFSSSNISLTYFRYLTSPAYLNAINNFVQTVKDSIVNKPTGYFNITAINEIPSVFFNALIHIQMGYTSSSSLFVSAAQMLTLKAQSSFFNLSIRKNWKRKYFIDLKSNLNFNTYKLSASLAGSISPKVLNLKNSITQRFWLNKQVNILINTGYFSHNLFTHKNASFTFLDTECNLKLKKMPIAFTLRGENLSNEKYYYSNNNEISIQSFYRIPLIKRRIFLSMQYDL